MKWRSLEETASRADERLLAEIYSERKQLIARYVPVQTQEIHARVVADLQGEHFAAGALKSGVKAPPFELRDHNGNPVSSTELLGKGPLVICFFRGRWCPFCVAQLQAMNLVVPEIQQAGASFIAISPQTVQQSFFMHDQHKLRFPLLSDPGNRVARQFGLVYKVPDYQQALYKRVFVNLAHTNGDESWELPIPATFILDRDGGILFASANEDYTERPEPAEILSRLKR